MKVLIEVNDILIQFDRERQKRFLESLLQAAGEDDAEISVTIVNDEHIRRLNHEYRGLDKPTDVLSFSQREGEAIGQHHALGDIVLSVETAQRQAEHLGHSLDDEIGELLFHGLIHLLGYDHDLETGEQWERMEAILHERLQGLHAPYIPKGIKVIEFSGSMIEGRIN